MAEQHLDHPDVDVLLEQMRGEAVPERVRRDPLPDAGLLGRGMDHPGELPRRHRVDRRPAGKQPAFGSIIPCRCPSRHQARRSASSCGESMAWRSLRPLPCSTRSIIRVLSTSPTLSATTSETRRPAP